MTTQNFRVKHTLSHMTCSCFVLLTRNGALSKDDFHLNLKCMNNFMAFYHFLTLLSKTKPVLVFITNIGKTILPLKLWFHYSSLKSQLEVKMGGMLMEPEEVRWCATISSSYLKRRCSALHCAFCFTLTCEKPTGFQFYFDFPWKAVLMVVNLAKRLWSCFSISKSFNVDFNYPRWE